MIASLTFIVACLVFDRAYAGPVPVASYIVGGKDRDSAPSWMVSLFREKPSERNWLSPICGGALIHSNLVLTAKHCVLDDSFDYYVTVGVLDRNPLLRENLIKVKEVKKREDDVDAAILVLSKSAILPRVPGKIAPHQPISLPLATELPAMNQRLWVYGWGDRANGEPSNRLQYVDVCRVDFAKCQEEFRKNGVPIPEDCAFNMCTEGYKDDYTGPCNGDSGGPLVDWSGGAKLVGIVKEALVGKDGKCETRLKYSHYVAVPALCKWIKDTAKATVIGDIIGTENCKDPKDELRRLQGCPVPTTTTTTQAPTSEGGTKCFPGNGLVTLETGNTKHLDEVIVGDRVQVMMSHGKVGFSDVIMMLHASPHVQQVYHVIYTSLADQPLRVSAEHLILVQEQGVQEPHFMFAGSVSFGNSLFIVQNGHLVASTITNITQEALPGKFAPLTLEGTVVVDHMVASCYAYVPSHDACHVAFAPARFLYQVAPWLLSNRPKPSCGMPDSVHWFPDMLQGTLGHALNILGLSIPIV